MPGRGLEVILIDGNIFHNPFISSLRFSMAPDYLAAIFGGRSQLSVFPGDKSCFLTVSEAKMT